MKKLNKDFLNANALELKDISIGSMDDFPEKIIQFGEGNFLRAFVDWQINEIIKQKLFYGKVVVVQPIETGMVDELNKQNGYYTLLRRGLQDGKQIEKTEIITCISRGLNPYKQWEEFLNLATKPEIRFIISNTTEAGIVYEDIPKNFNECPKSFPAKVVILLYERYKHFKADKKRGLIIIPCELIEKNGDTLKSCIIFHAKNWKLEEEFIKWIEECNHFCNTLVDRIVPGFPKDEITSIQERTGYEDKMLVTSELFHLWVIQASQTVQNELPFSKAGLNVVWTDDITPYRMLKVRILNGLHTMFTIPSFLLGNDTVKESLNHNLISKYIRRGLFEEILPTLDFPEAEKTKFAETVLERFQNPFIKHYLLSITLNSVSKYKVRVLPSLLKFVEKNNTLPKSLVFSLAALIHFYKGKFNGENEYFGLRFGKEYIIKDDPGVIQFFSELYSRYGNDYEKICAETLGNAAFWGMDLNSIFGFGDLVKSDLKNIIDNGINAALANSIGQ